MGTDKLAENTPNALEIYLSQLFQIGISIP